MLKRNSTEPSTRSKRLLNLIGICGGWHKATNRQNLFLFYICIKLAVLLAIVVARLCARRLRYKKKRYHPVAGTMLNQLINFTTMHHYMTELAGKYRTYRILDLFRSVVYIADPANVEYVLKTNFTNCGKGLYLDTILSDSLGDGIFAVDGGKLRHQRKASSSEFSTKMLRDFSSTVLQSSKPTQLNLLALFIKLQPATKL